MLNETQPIYDVYNKQKVKVDADRVVFDPYEAEINAFKEKYIYSHIFDTEAAKGAFNEWVHCVELCMENYRDWIPFEGPCAEAVPESIMREAENAMNDDDDDDDVERDNA
jgi:tRNA pseudouridine38-40 synthase